MNTKRAKKKWLNETQEQICIKNHQFSVHIKEMNDYKHQTSSRKKVKKKAVHNTHKHRLGKRHIVAVAVSGFYVVAPHSQINKFDISRAHFSR